MRGEACAGSDERLARGASARRAMITFSAKGSVKYRRREDYNANCAPGVTAVSRESTPLLYSPKTRYS